VPVSTAIEKGILVTYWTGDEGVARCLDQFSGLILDHVSCEVAVIGNEE
jgi:hypothetical protein